MAPGWPAIVVSQIQTARLGLRPTIEADFAFLYHILETPDFSNTSLLGLCHLSRFTAQSTSIIGADAQNPSGLLEPCARIGMVNISTKKKKKKKTVRNSEDAFP